MAADRVTYNVRLGDEWRRVAVALREIDSGFPGKLRRELREAVKPAAEDAKRNVLAIPTRGAKHSGLRGRVARGVAIQAGVARGLGVRIVTGMKDPQERPLPGYLDDNRGWRHPVFGNRHNWVHQSTGGSWFRETIVEHKPQIQRDVQQVLDDAAETIAAASRG